MEDNPNKEIILKLSKKDQDLLDLIETYLKLGRYSEAIELIHSRLLEEFDYETYYNNFLKIKLTMLLIDAGSEGGIESAVNKGIELFSEYYKQSKFISEGNYHYNIGNGKNALFEINTKDKYFNIPENIGYLIEAKDSYWSSLNCFQNENETPPIELYVNLGNTLKSCKRFIEAIQMYDKALKINPDFPYANINRSNCLYRMYYYTGNKTQIQLMQIYKGYENAYNVLNNSDNYPLTLKENCKNKLNWFSKLLQENGIDINRYNHDIEITESEAQKHSNYRKFCIDKKICLNDHSIYCNCNGAISDDLTISHQCVIGDFIPEMELLLNRLKSEFSLARWMYFEAFSSFSKVDEIINENVTFLEIYEDEIIGAKSEMLRNSFRMCFGILDKLAKGICKLFDLSKPKEDIYFQKFWNNKNNPDRFEKIKNIENPFILALYTLATDLNENGQLKKYKDFRNDLEHNVMILSEKENNDSFYFPGNDKNPIYKYENYTEFVESTEHLLHLTTSAILYFVYAVRHEGLKEKSSKNAGTIMLKSKIKG